MQETKKEDPLLSRVEKKLTEAGFKNPRYAALVACWMIEEKKRALKKAQRQEK